MRERETAQEKDMRIRKTKPETEKGIKKVKGKKTRKRR